MVNDAFIDLVIQSLNPEEAVVCILMVEYILGLAKYTERVFGALEGAL